MCAVMKIKATKKIASMFKNLGNLGLNFFFYLRVS